MFYIKNQRGEYASKGFPTRPEAEADLAEMRVRFGRSGNNFEVVDETTFTKGQAVEYTDGQGSIVSAVVRSIQWNATLGETAIIDTEFRGTLKLEVELLRPRTVEPDPAHPEAIPDGTPVIVSTPEGVSFRAIVESSYWQRPRPHEALELAGYFYYTAELDPNRRGQRRLDSAPAELVAPVPA